MKTNRIFSLFFTLLLAITLLVPAAAAAEGDAPTLPEPPELNCQAALLVDYNTGNVVYAKNEHQEMYPASLTKIMTALLVLEAVDQGQLSLGDELTASRSAMTTGLDEEGSTAEIQIGEIMTVEEYLTCMLVVSANEACNVLAEAVSGSVDAFVDAMNEKAAALGCENTHFVNPTGLHDPQHYTTAWDMYLITRAAMEHSDFMRICDTGTAHIPATNLSEERTLHTTNYLIDGWRSLGYRNSHAHDIKTGSTDAAGHCLVSSAMRGSLYFLSVVMGGERLTLEDGEIRTYSFYDTNLLYDWALDNFSYQTVILESEEIQEVPVLLSDIDHVTVHPAGDTEALLPTALSPEDLERRVEIQETVEAPVSAGQKLGTLTLSYDGVDYVTVDLLASFDVEANPLQALLRSIRDFFQRPVVRIVGIILIVLVVLLLVWHFFFGRRRYRYGRSVTRRRRNTYRGRRR